MAYRKPLNRMSMGELLEADFAEEVEEAGEPILVRRRKADGTVMTFTVKCLPQPLTPTFVHDNFKEASENLAENDQRAFAIAGRIAINDLDEFDWQNYTWEVSTSSEERASGRNILVYALCHKKHIVEENYEL